MSALWIALIGTAVAGLTHWVGWRRGFFKYHGVPPRSPVTGWMALGAGLITFLLCLAAIPIGGPSIGIGLSLVALLGYSWLCGKEVWRSIWGTQGVLGAMMGAVAILLVFPISFTLSYYIIALFDWLGVGYETLSPSFGGLNQIVALVLVGPIVEELLFRGFLQGALRRYLPRHPSLWITALTFGSVHFVYGRDVADAMVLPAILVGWYLGHLFEKYRTLWAPIACHCLYNALSLLLY